MRQREQSDFDTFYDRTYATTMARARMLCGGDQHLAEDLAAEAYLAVYQHWGRVGEYENLEGWMYRAMRQRFLKQWYRRSRLRARLAQQRPPEPATPDEPDITMGAIIAAVHALPDRQREVVVRRHLEHQSPAEIADAMGITSATVAAHLHKARQRLAAELGRGVTVLSREVELVAAGAAAQIDEQALDTVLGATGEALRSVCERDWAVRERVRTRVDELIDRAARRR